MKPYLIRTGNVRYTGLFPDSCAAVIYAMERFPDATRISVRVA